MGIEWRTNVISYVYQIAFTHEEFDALKNFCSLDPEILSALNVIHTVGITFQISNKIRIPLINEFALHPEGQKRFFEEFVDTNYIFNNYEYRIQEFLKHKSNAEAQLFGHCILFLADFLKMNLYGCRQQMKVINSIEPDNQIYPWPVGRWVAASIVNRHIVEENPIPDLESFIDHYRSIAYAYPEYLENGRIEFEMYIMVALVLTENYNLLARVIEKAHESYHKGEAEHKGFTWLSYSQNQLSYIFLDYARFKNSGELSQEKVNTCEEFINNYINFFDDFQYLILLNFFLMEYFVHLGALDKAREQLDQALVLARHSKYSFFEAFLYSKGADLKSCFASMAKDLIGESHFNPNAICFKSISVKIH